MNGLHAPWVVYRRYKLNPLGVGAKIIDGDDLLLVEGFAGEAKMSWIKDHLRSIEGDVLHALLVTNVFSLLFRLGGLEPGSKLALLLLLVAEGNGVELAFLLVME